MNGKLPITVLISTLNADEHLEELFDSILPYVEDVFITDSRSIDGTVDICLKHSVKIVQRPFINCGDQCAWSLNTLPIRTEWVFLMAQDERFSPSLVESLQSVFDSGIPDDVDGYTVKWRLWFMGRPLHAMTDNFRLLRRGRCRVTQASCNEHVVADGRVLKLRGILEHKDTLNLHQWYEKQNLWTTLEAIGRIKDNIEDERLTPLGTKLQRKMFFKRLFNRLPGGKMAMFWYYLLKYGAWRDGYAGWCWARLRVWVHRVGDMKEREFKKIGIPKVLPTARHGDFDNRVLASELQKKLLPETYQSDEMQIG